MPVVFELLRSGRGGVVVVVAAGGPHRDEAGFGVAEALVFDGLVGFDTAHPAAHSGHPRPSIKANIHDAVA
ncbi:hypothetical protein AB0K35_28140 [Micromonospora sp. NPDC053740]|uniref:hypothetical protein n=1 Tax=Micromonospora sp. NPDC053740 TaxID=3155173 RepID=UPI0034444F28